MRPASRGAARIYLPATDAVYFCRGEAIRGKVCLFARFLTHHKAVGHIARTVERAGIGDRFAVNDHFARRAAVQIGGVDGAEFDHQIHRFFLCRAEAAARAAAVDYEEQKGAVGALADTGPRLNAAAARADDGRGLAVDDQKRRVRVVERDGVAEALFEKFGLGEPAENQNVVVVDADDVDLVALPVAARRRLRLRRIRGKLAVFNGHTDAFPLGLAFLRALDLRPPVDQLALDAQRSVRPAAVALAVRIVKGAAVDRGDRAVSLRHGAELLAVGIVPAARIIDQNGIGDAQGDARRVGDDEHISRKRIAADLDELQPVEPVRLGHGVGMVGIQLVGRGRIGVQRVERRHRRRLRRFRARRGRGRFVRSAGSRRDIRIGERRCFRRLALGAGCRRLHNRDADQRWIRRLVDDFKAVVFQNLRDRLVAEKPRRHEFGRARFEHCNHIEIAELVKRPVQQDAKGDDDQRDEARQRKTDVFENAFDPEFSSPFFHIFHNERFPLRRIAFKNQRLRSFYHLYRQNTTTKFVTFLDILPNRMIQYAHVYPPAQDRGLQDAKGETKR